MIAPHQDRVVAEESELQEKHIKLSSFIGSQTYLGLPEAEKERLLRQSHHMAEYRKVLMERIAAFHTQSQSDAVDVHSHPMTHRLHTEFHSDCLECHEEQDGECAHVKRWGLP